MHAWKIQMDENVEGEEDKDEKANGKAIRKWC